MSREDAGMTIADGSVLPKDQRPQLRWFAAWVGVGVGLALGISALGLIAVPLALLAALVLAVRHHVGHSALGILVGMGLVSLYVAWVQRRGPGTVQWHTATASGSEQFLDPRPWLIAGLLLVAIGTVAFLWRGRRSS
jgi:hypothetical protein